MRKCVCVTVCVSVVLGEQGTRGQLQLFLIGFYSLSLESTDTHGVITALLPFSGYFVTFAPPHNKENGSAKPEERKREEEGGERRKGQKKISGDQGLTLKTSS